MLMFSFIHGFLLFVLQEATQLREKEKQRQEEWERTHKKKGDNKQLI